MRLIDYIDNNSMQSSEFLPKLTRHSIILYTCMLRYCYSFLGKEIQDCIIIKKYVNLHLIIINIPAVLECPACLGLAVASIKLLEGSTQQLAINANSI